MSAQLEAFIEYITIIKALSKASIEAYTNDLSLIEEHYKASLIHLDEKKLLLYLAQFENKRTLKGLATGTVDVVVFKDPFSPS